MLVLGIEGTAHTLGFGLIDYDKKEVLLNIRKTFNSKNGMDLRKLTNFHMENFYTLLEDVKSFLQKRNLSFKDIKLISFSIGPGIGNSLKIASLIAKTLALKYKIRIIGVNHIISHYEVGKWILNLKNPLFLNVTGVNSQVVNFDLIDKKYKVYGETLDIGLGNLFDKVARLFNLGFPGGFEIEKRAKFGKNLYEIPYSIKGMNLSFSGIYTFIKNKFEKIKNEDDKKNFINDICYSLQEICFSMLIEVCERAIFYVKKDEICVVGGVAKNKRFTNMLKKMCESRNLKYKETPQDLCMDNGVMIAVCGAKNYKLSKLKIKGLKPKPYIRCEDGAVF